MIYTITRLLFKTFFQIFFRLKAYGLENIPREGPFIMAPNHVSYLDPIVVGAFVPRKLNYLAKKDLFKNRFFGWYLRQLRTIPVDRDMPSYSGMKEVVRNIKKGDPVVLFPEGRRSNGDFFLEPEMGAAYLALRFNLPVVSVYVKGTKDVLPKDGDFIRLNSISVFYGKPKRYLMPANSVNKESGYRQVSYKIMEEITELKSRYG